MVLALAWAVYLIPQALKHHDEIARTRSVDRFSTAMRVLARREPVNRRNARLVVTPARSADRVVLPSSPRVQAPTDDASTRPPDAAGRAAARNAARRAAARAAARRRRRVLSVLLLADLVVAVLVAVGVLAWWSVAIPVVLTLVYLLLCRRQVRRENDASWARTEPADPTAASPAAASAQPADAAKAGLRPSAEPLPRRAIRVDASYGTPQEVAAGHAEFSDQEDTVAIPMEELHTVAVTVETVDGGSLWDPLPVTLPTYVGKARASRTVRTIDLNAAGTWSSGRDESDSRLVEESAAAAAVQEDPTPEETPRAVGT